jgi:hypothetical protein
VAIIYHDSVNVYRNEGQHDSYSDEVNAEHTKDLIIIKKELVKRSKGH